MMARYPIHVPRMTGLSGAAPSVPGPSITNKPAVTPRGRLLIILVCCHRFRLVRSVLRYRRSIRLRRPAGIAEAVSRFSHGKQMRQPRICSPAAYRRPHKIHFSRSMVFPSFQRKDAPRAGKICENGKNQFSAGTKCMPYSNSIIKSRSASVRGWPFS